MKTLRHFCVTLCHMLFYVCTEHIFQVLLLVGGNVLFEKIRTVGCETITRRSTHLQMKKRHR